MGLLSSAKSLLKDNVGSLLDLGGSALAGYSSARGVEQANAQNLAIAREQMQFQKGMSDTEVQRRVADLRAAGINPVLGLNSGGASAPSGAGYVAQDSSTPGINSAREAMRTAAELRRVAADTAAVKQSERTNKATEIKEITQAELNKASIGAVKAGTVLSNIEAVQKGMLTPLYQKGGGLVEFGADQGTNSAKGFWNWFRNNSSAARAARDRDRKNSPVRENPLQEWKRKKGN